MDGRRLVLWLNPAGHVQLEHLKTGNNAGQYENITLIKHFWAKTKNAYKRNKWSTNILAKTDPIQSFSIT